VPKFHFGLSEKLSSLGSRIQGEKATKESEFQPFRGNIMVPATEKLSVKSHNCSEREVKLASLDLHRSRQKVAQVITISAKEKAAYLESAEAKEVLLLHFLCGI